MNNEANKIGTAKWLIVNDRSEVRTAEVLIERLTSETNITISHISLPAEEWKLSEELESAEGICFLFHEPGYHMQLIESLASQCHKLNDMVYCSYRMPECASYDCA